MNEAWRDADWGDRHWRGVAVALAALGFIAAAAWPGGGDARCPSPLEHAHAALRELPSSEGAAFDVDRGPADGRQASACAAQPVRNRDAQRALKRTVTITTAAVIDRNARHVVRVADARPNAR